MDPRRILVVRPDRVGDVIISSACLPALRARFPQAEIVYAAGAALQPLFDGGQGHPLGIRFYPLPAPTLPFRTRFGALVSSLKEPRFDVAVSLHPDPAFYLAAWRVGIPRRIGYPLRFLSWTLTDPIANRRPECHYHEAFYSFDPLAPLGVFPSGPLRASIHLPPAAGAALRAKLGELPGQNSSRYVCLHLGAWSPVARWPVASFLALAEALRERHGVEIVLVGHDPADASHIEFRARAKTDGLPFLDTAGKLSLAELGWLLRGAACLVTRDTGPSHLAAAVECPVVVLFGRHTPPYGPKRWAPLGDEGRVRVILSPAVKRPKEPRQEWFRRAFAEIPVDPVAAAASEFLT